MNNKSVFSVVSLRILKVTHISRLKRASSIALICCVFPSAVASFSASAAPKNDAPAPIQVMILGAYHMGNPGLDLNNAKVDSVLTPEKQKQLVEVANRLAKFKPNKIAIEMVANQPDMTTSDFAKFTPASLLTDANEITQIAYRLANQLGHKVVYAIDEQSKTISYFPFGKVEEFAKANNQQNLLEGGTKWGARFTAEFEKAQKTRTVRELLLTFNKPQYGPDEMRSFYLPLLAVANADTQPGADLNAAWYLRNAKIFAKLTLAAKPGDKILVVFGAGHNYWLRHFVSQMPGYQLVEATTYLK